MVDVTLQIIRENKAHDLSYDPNKEARRYRRGDVIDAWLATKHATLDGSNDYRINAGAANAPFFYIHITGVPTNVAVKIRERLTEGTGETTPVQHNDGSGGFYIADVADDHRRRKWRIPRSVLTAPVRATLIAEGELTVTWTQAKERIRRKVIVNRQNRDLDDESNTVTDAEIL